MIAHLSGLLLDKDARRVQRLVIDVHGVGYEVLAPLSTIYTLGETGSPVSLRIFTHVREDAFQLFGFATALEHSLFERLIGVNGVGPKLALAILSGIESADLGRAIRNNDLGRLTAIPGVGRKTAERLVVELRDRLAQDFGESAVAPASGSAAVREDLLSALANLGYQRAAAEKAVDRVLGRESNDAAFEPALRDVLKELAR
ncbi:MAG: Holliday junction branch migration protein RuvA [Vicinamibacterales bacterium]